MQETGVRSLGREDVWVKGMATHSSIPAWRIPWTEESGGLQSVGSKRVRHDWATNTFTLYYQNMLYSYRGVCVCAHMCVCVCGAQSCTTICDPMDWSSSGSSVHGIFQARILEMYSSLLQGIFLTQGLNPHFLYLLHCVWILYHRVTWAAHNKVQLLSNLGFFFNCTCTTY